jgi:hypothetical protein
MDMAAELRRSKAKRRRWDEEEDEIVSYLMTMDDSSPEKSDESQEFLTILREDQIRRKYEDLLYRKEQMEFRKDQIRRKYEDLLYRKEQMEFRKDLIRRRYEDLLYRKEQMKFQKEDHALNTIKVIGDRMRALESQSGGKDTETYSQLERIYNKALDILEK